MSRTLRRRNTDMFCVTQKHRKVLWMCVCVCARAGWCEGRDLMRTYPTYKRNVRKTQSSRCVVVVRSQCCLFRCSVSLSTSR